MQRVGLYGANEAGLRGPSTLERRPCSTQFTYHRGKVFTIIELLRMCSNRHSTFHEENGLKLDVTGKFLGLL